jgi:hypothetical protein
LHQRSGFLAIAAGVNGMTGDLQRQCFVGKPKINHLLVSNFHINLSNVSSSEQAISLESSLQSYWSKYSVEVVITVPFKAIAEKPWLDRLENLISD